LLTGQWFSRQRGELCPLNTKRGEQFGTPSGTSQYTYSDRILFKFMNIGSSSQNPHHAMEINQVALREGLDSEESDARHSAHGSTGSRRSRTGSRRMDQIQESVLRQEFRKDREAAMARIPNPDAVVQQLDLPYGPPPGLAWPYQENPLIAQIAGIPGLGEVQAGQRGEALPVQEREAPVGPEGPAPVQMQQNQPEPQHIPQDQPLALLPEPPAVLPYRPRRIDPNPFPPPARGRRGGRGNNLFANNDRNRLGANWRNNPGLEEQEGHREEVLPRPYRAEPMIDYAQPEQGRNHHPINALNDVGALQRMIREMMEPEARRGERPTYRKPYPAYIDQIPLPPGFKVPSFTLVFHDYYYRIQPEITISDLAALKQSEDEPAQDFITRFRKLKMKCRIPMEEKHFIQMAQAALKISLRKRFDGILFGDPQNRRIKHPNMRNCLRK
ncbi:unnamed protein product, partial [Prunus brigantina]